MQVEYFFHNWFQQPIKTHMAMSCRARYVMQVIKIIGQTKNSFNKSILSLSLCTICYGFHTSYLNRASFFLLACDFGGHMRRQWVRKNVSYTMFIMIMKMKSENRSNYFRKE